MKGPTTEGRVIARTAEDVPDVLSSAAAAFSSRDDGEGEGERENREAPNLEASDFTRSDGSASFTWHSLISSGSRGISKRRDGE